MAMIAFPFTLVSLLSLLLSIPVDRGLGRTQWCLQCTDVKPKSMVQDCAAAFSTDGTLVAEAGHAHVELRERATGRMLDQRNTNSKGVGACRFLAFSPDSRWLVSIMHTQSFSMRDAGKAQFRLSLWEIIEKNKLRLAREMIAEDPRTIVCCAGFSPDSRSLVSGTPEGKVHVWDCETWKERVCVAGGIAATFAPDGRALFALSHDGEISQFDARTGRLLSPARDAVRSDFIFPVGAAFAPNWERVAVWDEYEVLLQECPTGKRLGRMSFGDRLKCASFSPDGSVLIVVLDNEDCILFDATSGKEVGFFKDGSPDTRQLVVTANCKILEQDGRNVTEIRDFARLASASATRPQRVAVEPLHVPMELTLIARKRDYVLDLHGETARQFSRSLLSCWPSSPPVDLEIQLRCTGTDTISFFPELRVEFFLEGPGAMNVAWYGSGQTICTHDADAVSAGPVTLFRGQTYSVRVTELKYSEALVRKQSYWLLPGEYAVHAKCHVIILPDVAKTVTPGEALEWVRLRSKPVKVKVAENKN